MAQRTYNSPLGPHQLDNVVANTVYPWVDGGNGAYAAVPWLIPTGFRVNDEPLYNLARTFTLTGVVVGTEVRLHVNDGNASDGLGTEIDGVESAASSTVVLDYTYTGDVIDAVLVLIKPGYRYQRLTGFQLGQNSQSFPVQQVLDRAYSNPA